MMSSTEATAVRPLHKIADEILKLWRADSDSRYHSMPYIRAMRYLATMDDKYGDQDAEEIVMYFLSNARGWRGEDAKRVKAELKSMLEGARR